MIGIVKGRSSQDHFCKVSQFEEKIKNQLVYSQNSFLFLFFLLPDGFHPNLPTTNIVLESKQCKDESSYKQNCASWKRDLPLQDLDIITAEQIVSVWACLKDISDFLLKVILLVLIQRDFFLTNF